MVMDATASLREQDNVAVRSVVVIAGKKQKAVTEFDFMESGASKESLVRNVERLYRQTSGCLTLLSQYAAALGQCVHVNRRVSEELALQACAEASVRKRALADVEQQLVDRIASVLRGDLSGLSSAPNLGLLDAAAAVSVKIEPVAEQPRSSVPRSLGSEENAACTAVIEQALGGAAPRALLPGHVRQDAGAMDGVAGSDGRSSPLIVSPDQELSSAPLVSNGSTSASQVTPEQHRTKRVKIDLSSSQPAVSPNSRSDTMQPSQPSTL